jgi:hypothetical protein
MSRTQKRKKKEQNKIKRQHMNSKHPHKKAVMVGMKREVKKKRTPP